MLILKGPRVKHVCRSASVVLGQPLATFPSDLSPIKKQTNDGAEDCKSDNTTTTNNNSEAQVINKSDAEDGLSEAKQSNKDKKASSSKESYLSKGSTSRVGQQITTNKSKKKNGKIENPVSMDFWESYDPEEICETGFGLIGSETFTVRALCFLCGSSGREKVSEILSLKNNENSL